MIGNVKKNKEIQLKLIKLSIELLIIFAVILMKADLAQAKELKKGTTYNIDLNGDGKKEKIKYNVIMSDNDIYEGYNYLYVNGKKIKIKFDATNSRVYVVDINRKDKYKEIYVHNTSFSDVFEGAIAFRYKNGSLRKYFTFSSKDKASVRMRIMDNQPGNGKVYFESEYADSYIGQGLVKQAYNVSSGKLKVAKAGEYSTTSLWRTKKYKAIKSLKVYGKIGGKKAKFTLHSGNVFHVLKIKPLNYKDVWGWTDSNYSIPYIYIKTESGKQGWIKNPGVKFYRSYDDYSGKYWDMIYCWG